MTIFKHELRQGRAALAVWSAVIAGMLGICIIIYPDMAQQMGAAGNMFADMGSFSAAFGMDQINFGEFLGFFGVECGNVLGLGGAFFAGMLGISALAREERDHTAEFLLTHPVRRSRILLEKLGCILAQLLILNLLAIGVTAGSVRYIGQKPDLGTLSLLFLAYFLLQVEIAALCFGISAFLRRGGAGIGLGIAALLYFLNIIANLTDRASFLRYITPFGYTEGAHIILNGSIDIRYLSVGLGVIILSVVMAFYQYTRKDIYA